MDISTEEIIKNDDQIGQKKEDGSEEIGAQKSEDEELKEDERKEEQQKEEQQKEDIAKDEEKKEDERKDDMKAKKDEKNELSIFIGSCNVGNAKFDDLSNWIPKNPNYDIIVLGLQESFYSVERQELETLENLLEVMNIQIEHLGSELNNTKIEKKEIAKSTEVEKQTEAAKSVNEKTDERNIVEGQTENDLKSDNEENVKPRLPSAFSESSDESDEEFGEGLRQEKKDNINESLTKIHQESKQNQPPLTSDVSPNRGKKKKIKFLLRIR